MTLTGPTARPIRFTSDLAAWEHVLRTLGGAPVHVAQGWVVHQLGGGRLALHQGSGDDGEQAGATTICVETSVPLEEAVAAVRAVGVPMRLEETGHGLAGVLRAGDGTLVTLDAPTRSSDAGAVVDPRLAVLPIWYAEDVTEPRAVLEALGAVPDLVGDDGVWAELALPGGGRVGVHASDAGSAVELAFRWDGDVEVALTKLTAAGVEAVLIDETYGCTVQVVDPDGGKEIWINERQTDLYGYSRPAV
jgi:hypothetical protein